MKKVFIVASAMIFVACVRKNEEKMEDNKDVKEQITPKQKQISSDEAVALAMKKFDAYLPTILTENGDMAIDLQVSHTGDFTGDGVEDVAVYFNLVPKDGGNAILSQGLTLYKNIGNDVKVIAGYEPDYLFAFDTIKNGKIHVTMLEYAEDDGHCCPSIKTPHILTIKGSKAY
ncbi:hypothetical protein H1R17_07160 [Flavobacterium sp. xlx-214]|uniref:hypothetical protein n=1 Tax=unclassified Flavobacterium TaxID=196869 RepID=UPI0013D1F4F5|nr:MULTISPECIES: hypothetical protein [unclassified Flavobacterium]MBA5793803.1 hypothetical protein [Flavobacterium sp. xlx-221]QMI82287.1 hypothetical protein H1R17_07160 [Flavobacterium sp. xlx-214]